MRRALTTLALGAAVLTGCAAPPLRPVQDEPRMAAARAQHDPLPVRIGVGLPQLALVDPGEHGQHVVWPVGAIQKAVVAVLQAGAIATDVSALPASAGDRDGQLAVAWDRRQDLLCEITVTKVRAGYVGTNGLYIPNLLLWMGFVWPAWFIPDEDYDVTVEAQVRFVAVATGREVWSRTIEANVAESFDDFQRGVILFGEIRVPGALDETNYRAVAGYLLDPCAREWQLRVAEQSGEALRRAFGTDRYRDATRQTLAVVVGCGKYGSYALHNLRYAAADARAVAGWLRGAGVDDRQQLLLLDDRATAEGIRAAVRDFLAARARRGDRVIFYYAGYAGPGTDGALALLPYDTDPREPGRGGLPLAELAELFGTAGTAAGAEVLCIVDAGLGGSAEERWATLDRAAPSAGAVREALRALSSRANTAVVWGCSPGEGAAEITEVGHGLCTLNWLAAVRRAADLNGDGIVSVAEAFREFSEAVQTHAMLAGRTQSPIAGGLAADGALAVPRRAGETETDSGGGA